MHAALGEAGFGDIRPAHAAVFPFIPADGIQIGELAARAVVRKQSMAQSVRELEQAGYLTMRTDPADRRAKLVRLTSKGEAVRPAAVAAGRTVEAHWAGLLGAGELEQLRTSLSVLLARISESDQ